MTHTIALLIAAAFIQPARAEEPAYDYQFYGSLRMQAESVHPDRESVMSDYRGLRDAFSRVGVHAAYRWTPDTRLFMQVEVPFDSANLRFSDSYDQGGVGRSRRENLRVARVGLDTRAGTLVAGQQWMPYYNAITFPVDQFSTFYSGFATYTTFRVKETLAYASPDFNGFSFGGSYSSAAGNIRSPSRIDDRRIQAVASYAFGDTTLAAGMDDRGNADGFRDRIYGLTLSHSVGNWNLAAKFEITDNDDPNSFYGHAARAFNLYGDYTRGKNTWKLMLADVEAYGETVIHAGLDHRYSEALTLFAEYYQEQETAALTGKQEGLAGFDAAISGGRMFAVGFRYSFDF